MRHTNRRTTMLCLLGGVLLMCSACAQQGTTTRAETQPLQQMAAMNWQDSISAQTMSPTKNAFLIMMR